MPGQRPRHEPTAAEVKTGSPVGVGGTPPASAVDAEGNRTAAAITAADARQIALALSAAPEYDATPAPFPKDGQELWVAALTTPAGATPPEYQWFRLAQTIEIHGPDFEITGETFTKTDNITVPDPATGEQVFTVYEEFKVPGGTLKYKPIIGRGYYNPYMPSYSGEDGLLGHIIMPRIATFALTYRNPNTNDALYLPSFMLRWVNNFWVSKFTNRIVGYWEVADFHLEPVGRYIFYQAQIGPSPYDLINDPGTLAPRTPLQLPAYEFRKSASQLQTAGPLPTVQDSLGNPATAYAVSNLPTGVTYDTAARTLRVEAADALPAIGIYMATLAVTYASGLVAYYSLPISIVE